MSRDVKIEIEIDLDTGTYDLGVQNVSEPGVALDEALPSMLIAVVHNWVARLEEGTSTIDADDTCEEPADG